MCHSIDDFLEGENFSILEFNGSGSIPNHVFTPNFTLWQAYKEIRAHWKVLFEISSYNHKEGLVYWPFLKGLRFLRNALNHCKTLRKYNKMIAY